MTPKIVWVEWVDSVSRDGWLIPEEDTGPKPIRTIGFLVKETEEALTVSGTFATDPTCVPFCGLLTIPLVAVTKWGEVTMPW